jgi:hypothetical protein
VQSSNFTTLFVLSREREVEDSVLDVSALMVGITCAVVLTFNCVGLDREGRATGLELGQRDQE